MKTLTLKQYDILDTFEANFNGDLAETFKNVKSIFGSTASTKDLTIVFNIVAKQK